MNRAKIAAFLAASFFFWMSQFIYVPSLAGYIHLRTASLAAVGIVLSMYGLWQAIIRIPLGVAVDKTGSGKSFLIACFLVGASGALVLAFGRTIGVLTVGRALNGLAAGAWVPLVVAFSALFPPKQIVVATSLLTVSGSLGRMIGTSLTGFLNSLGGYSLTFYAGAVLAMVSIAIIGATKVERRKTQKVSTKSILKIFMRGDVLIPSIISAVAQCGIWAVIFGFMPLLASQVGASEVVQGLLVSANILTDTMGSLLNTVVVRKLTRTRLLYICFFVFASGIGLFSIARVLPLFFVATVLMGTADGFAYPTLMGLSIERVDQARRTTAMGIHQSVYAIGMFAGPWIGGLLAHAAGIRWTFCAIAVFTIVSTYPLIRLRRKVVSTPIG